MYALAQQMNFCLEKMVWKLGIVIVAIAIFSGGGMSLNATENVIGYYAHENTISKEQLNALFLLNKDWLKDLRAKYPKNQIKEVADGIVYIRQTRIINSRKVRINIAEINRNVNPDIEISPKMASSKLHARNRINKIAPNAKIAVNGTYFKQDTGTPLGTLVINNEIITGPIFERVSLGIGETGFKTSRAAFEGYIKYSDNIIRIDNINQPRMMFTQTLIYTPVWGETSPVTKKPSKHIVVSNGKIIKISSNPVAIPKDGYVISAMPETVADLKKGDIISAEYKINPEWKDMQHVISGGPYLIKEGNIFVDVKSQRLTGITGRNPRTAIGYTADNHLILITADGREGASVGLTLNELAGLMKQLGCVNAMNLDGGGSTVMYVNGQVVNRPAVQGGIPLSHTLVIRKDYRISKI